MVICLQMGKTYTAKTLFGDFKVTTPENPLLSKQTITSKETLVPYTLNPYPNTQLDLFYSDNLSFSMHDSQYVTNQFDTQIPVRGLLTNLRKMLTAKFFNSTHDEDHETLWLQNPAVYKHSSFFKRKMNKGKSVSGHNSHERNFAPHLHNLWWPLKQFLYMFRVVRKESLNIYSLIGWKSELKICFSKILTDSLSIKKLSSIGLE